MYDVDGARPNNMGFSETTDFVTYQDLGHFNEGLMKGTNFTRPKHGAVTHLTADELKAVAAHWKVDLSGLPRENKRQWSYEKLGFPLSTARNVAEKGC